MDGSRCDPYPLREAREIAEDLLAKLSPACERIVLAGSIRREKPHVHDVELVAIPRTEESVAFNPQPDLFGSDLAGRAVRRVNLLWDRIEEVSRGHQEIVPLKPGTAGLEADLRWREKRAAGSRYLKLYLPGPGLKVDLFMADPRTWGLVLAIRTGSSDFSRALVTRWTHVSGGGHARDGLLRHPDGRIAATPQEEDVFRACRVVWMHPQHRRTANDLHPEPAHGLISGAHLTENKG